jgi:hypothetical protein
MRPSAQVSPAAWLGTESIEITSSSSMSARAVAACGRAARHDAPGPPRGRLGKSPARPVWPPRQPRQPRHPGSPRRVCIAARGLEKLLHLRQPPAGIALRRRQHRAPVHQPARGRPSLGAWMTNSTNADDADRRWAAAGEITEFVEHHLGARPKDGPSIRAASGGVTPPVPQASR